MTNNIDLDYVFPTPIWKFEIEEALKRRKISLEDIVSEVLKWEKEGSKRHRSNQGGKGFQSGDINYDQSKNDPLNVLINEIHFALEAIHQSSRHGTVQHLNSWINLSRKGTRNLKHNHPGAFYSGVVYLSCPKDSGNLILNRDDLYQFATSESNGGMLKNRESTEPHNSQVWTIKPKEGRVIVFPSWLSHEVEENKTNKVRISIAFNFGPINAWPEN